jgi:hypothetical protein
MTPTLEQRVARLEAWTEVLMGGIGRLGAMAEPLLTELEGARKLYNRDDDPHRDLFEEHEEDTASSASQTSHWLEPGTYPGTPAAVMSNRP